MLRFVISLAILSLCIGNAEAKRKHRRAPSVAELLEQNLALLRKQVAEQAKIKAELAAINRMLRPRAVAYVPPLDPRPSPSLHAPMKIPDPAIAPPATAAVLGKVENVNPKFLTKLAAMRADMPKGLSFRIGSGFRTRAQQAALYRAKPGLAAPPGRSNHERGLAADLDYSSPAAGRWVRRNAARYALRFPMSYEPWHVEPVGVTRVATARRKRRVYATHHVRPDYRVANYATVY